MKKTFNMKLLLTLALITIISAASAQSAGELEVSAAVESLRVAMLDGNKLALESLTASDLSYGHSGGNIEDKAAFVDAIVSGRNDFIKLELSAHSIKIVGKDLAIVRHNFKAEATANGAPITPNIGVLQVWQKQKGSWKLLARQAFKLP